MSVHGYAATYWSGHLFLATMADGSIIEFERSGITDN
jgi:hypothetical protein